MAMDFDQSFSGPVDWNFPSPNATPTHQAYTSDVYTTPKTTTFQSHFQDAFSTPQIPNQNTPRLPSSTGAQYALNAPPAVQNGFVLPQTQGISPLPQWQQSMRSPSQAQLSQSFDSILQTPPPTRDADAWKAQQQLVAFGTPSTIATRRLATPRQDGAMTLASQTPLQFNGLQVPALDTSQIMNTGPATAPVQSSSINFWDSLASPTALKQSNILDDPFSSKMPVNAMANQHLQPMSFEAASFQNAEASPSINDASRPTLDRSLMTGSVDPSLVYSSPMSAMSRPSSVRAPRALAQTTQPGLRFPSSDHRHKRLDSGESDYYPARPSTMLRRSNTTGSTSAATPDLIERLQQPRTSSPLKRVRPHLGSISETTRLRQRASVILTVDESGLARTETVPGDDSMRARYPGLFDSDSSDAESDGSPEPPSRRTSFAYKKKQPKLDPPIEKFEGLSIPRSSSSASMRNVVSPSRAAVAAAAQLRRQGSLRRSGSGRLAHRKVTAPIDTHPMNMADDQNWASGGAEHQIEHDMQQTSRSTRSTRQSRSVTLQNTLDAHNRRWSMMSMEQSQPESMASLSAGPMRSMTCICGTLDDHGSAVVQCTLCTRWSHSACVGVRAGSSSQANFTCFLCTRPASNNVSR